MSDLKKNQILLSRFSLLEIIGKGGMGEVWLAWDLELETRVAVKVLNPRLSSRPDRIELLKNECRNTRRLIHPNIVRVFDFHRFEDLAFISMEYIDGLDLNAYRNQLQHFDPAAVQKILKPVINALGYAHELGLVHRDVKASNILVDRQKTPRLTDFGIAGVFRTSHNALQIASGGSLYSMSPQQLDGRPPLPSDDIYALGTLLYEMFAGYPPFYPDITRDKILHETPQRINQRLGPIAADVNIPGALENLIVQMLAKQPDERPGNMREIENQLDRLLEIGVDETRPPDVPDIGGVTKKPAIGRMEIITPVRVARKAVNKGLPFNERSNLIKGLTLAFTFVFLLTGGLWLWHYLAGRSAGKPRVEIPVTQQSQAMPQKTDAKSEVASENPPEPAELSAEKEQAEQKLAEFMQLKQELESKGAPTWAQAAYAEMMQLAAQADQLLIENNHLAAAAKYAEASAKARILADRIKPTLNRLLAEGQAALTEGNAESARQKLTAALMIDPDNKTAQHGLQRAENAAAVNQLMQQGAAHEKEGDRAFALADYQKALRLDPESKEAQQALVRAKRLISDQEFQQLMSEGLSALHANNYSLAREKLLKAQSFRPTSQEAKDALAQVDQSIRLAGIESYRRKADDAEQAEKWEQALDAYLQVLKIDPDIQFAIQGKQRALAYIRLDKRINFFLKQPAVLESDRQLENAIQLMAEIKKIDPRGPRLKDQLAKLTRMVDAAQTPIKITLESDGLTEVAVYKVGKLGRFASRVLSLRPGTYTVVGTRDGYQDVRKQFTIKSGQKPARIAIQCEVKI
jgi:serine/threonine protein kinase/tetratricopeptide (TPR) repeat protein